MEVESIPEVHKVFTQAWVEGNLVCQDLEYPKDNLVDNILLPVSIRLLVSTPLPVSTPLLASIPLLVSILLPVSILLLVSTLLQVSTHHPVSILDKVHLRVLLKALLLKALLKAHHQAKVQLLMFQKINLSLKLLQPFNQYNQYNLPNKLPPLNLQLLQYHPTKANVVSVETKLNTTKMVKRLNKFNVSMENIHCELPEGGQLIGTNGLGSP